MRHEREKHLPPLPQTIEAIVLSDDIRNLSGDEFVSLDGNILMMAKNPTLKQLEGNQSVVSILIVINGICSYRLISETGAACIYMDGTFFAAPGLFKQLYTLHALVTNSRGSAMICGAYFLLPDLQQSTYIKMLQMLQTRCLITATVKIIKV